MSLSVNNQNNSGIDAQTLRSVTQAIFKRAEAKANGTLTPLTNTQSYKSQILGVDLYNGKTDSNTAKRVAMNNSMQFTSQRLTNIVAFLNSQAAQSIHKQVDGKMTVAVNETTTKSDNKIVSFPKFDSIIKLDLSHEKNGSSNPFAQTGNKKSENAENNQETTLNIVI